MSALVGLVRLVHNLDAEVRYSVKVSGELSPVETLGAIVTTVGLTGSVETTVQLSGEIDFSE